MFPHALRPTRVLARAGAFDTWPNTIARMKGATRLVRAGIARETAPVAPTPSVLADQLGASRLVRYKSATPVRYERPVLLVPSLINRHYVLDLLAGNSLVEGLLQAGHAVYLIDWGEPGPEELGLSFGDFVLGRLRSFVDATSAHAGGADVHLVGQCLGGTMATCLAAVDDRKLATLTNLTAPLEFHDEGMLSAWGRAPFFDPEAFADAMGHVPSWITQPSFFLLRPMGQPVKALRLWQNLGSERFVEFFRALETWINDPVSIPRGFFIDLVQQLYRRNALARGTFKLLGEPVLLEEVSVPVLTVAAKKDHIVPVQSAIAGFDRFANDDKRLEVFEGGHIGVVVGSGARKRLWPLLLEWFADHASAAEGPDADVLPLPNAPLDVAHLDDERTGGAGDDAR